ncbi:MAG: molybdopterin-synthase adenylyltransferase MoeB [Deltaproteobacteria bacterium]|nr:molybdopterin-synthase adenylyltransferase MoeB [Deltaproteobacteria bacterium]
MAKIIIPTPLRKYTHNQAETSVEGKTISEILERLVTTFPDLKKNIFEETGNLRAYINIFVGDENIRDLKKERTELKGDSVVSLVPAIAGGSEGCCGSKKEEVDFSPEEMRRYSRHFSIPEFNIEGQKKLKAAKVLVVGAGGLGCPALLYLSAAGVGTLGIVDHDVVDESNLQRQILFDVTDVGQFKVDIAKKKILALNPHVQVKTFKTKLTSQNALGIIKDFDIVVDGTDNFPTRYLVNDACVFLNKPNVYGSVFRFEGQVAVFNYTDKNGTLGPNYRCLYSAPPPAGLVPNCAEGGILGILPGIIGSLQVNEVIKIITGIGEPLSGRLVIFDALTFKTRVLKVTKDENNPLNGKNPTITKLIDYEQFCGVQTQPSQKEDQIKEVTVQELKSKIDKKEPFQLIDVREQFEYDIVNLSGELVPLSQVENNPDLLSSRIEKDKPVIIHCKMGGRSAKAVELVQQKYGYKNLYSLRGGIIAYANEIDPLLSTY